MYGLRERDPVSRLSSICRCERSIQGCGLRMVFGYSEQFRACLPSLSSHWTPKRTIPKSVVLVPSVPSSVTAELHILTYSDIGVNEVFTTVGVSYAE